MLRVTSPELRVFDIYLKELLAWNEKFNLTAITNSEEIKSRHFEDSLSILEAVDLQGQKVIDIGAGAGFPGIPLKIARPNISLTLIDSTQKKINFLNHIIQTLDLKNTQAIWGRAEDLSKDKKYNGQYDIALARAVAKLPDLLKYCMPFLKVGGVFLAQKQFEIEDEIKAAKHALRKYHAQIEKIHKIEIAGIKRSLLVIKKI